MMQAHELLEREWAEFNDLDPAGMVACSSGTAALHLALEALGLPPGSEVLVPDFTMVACARAVTLAGLTPVFVDCGMDLNLDPALIGSACEGGHVRAAMPVHVYGRRCDMGTLHKELAHHSVGSCRFPVVVIEDLAEAHGVRPHPATAAAAWSFYRNKIVAGEEGGAVWFRDKRHAALARQLRCLGFTPDHDFVHLPRGHNYRLADRLAQLIIRDLRSCGLNYHGPRGRLAVEKSYDAYCPDEWRQPKRDAVWVYDVRIPGLTRTKQVQVVRALNEQGIAARCSFWPMHLQPEYAGRCRLVSSQGEAPASVRAANEVLYLPVRPGISRGQCEANVAALVKAVQAP